MKHACSALLAITLVVVIFIATFSLAASNPEPAKAQGQGCILDIQGPLGVVLCGGQIVDSLNLPTVKVTLRVPGPAGPTQTVTVREPQETKTVTRPQETETVYVSSVETELVRETTTAAPAQPSPTGPVETVTEETTVAATPSRQDDPTDGKIEPDHPSVDFGDGETTIVEAGIGILSILALVGLIVLALYSGYVLGYKDKERNETKFLRAILDQSKLRRGKHS